MLGEKRWPKPVGFRKKTWTRKPLFELLEDRLVLTTMLRPGPVPDDVVLFPTDQPGEFQIAADPIAADDFTMIDLSVDTPADQRHTLLLSQGTLVKVDTNERYTLTTKALTGDHLYSTRAIREILNITSLDVDQKVILPIHVTRHTSAVDTVLAQDLRPGDKSVFIEDASGWSNDSWESAETRALAWYGYTDSTGYTYDDYSYTRNVTYDFKNGLWEPGAIQYDSQEGSYRIDLLAPWNGPLLTAGSAIRNAAQGQGLQVEMDDAFANEYSFWEERVQRLGGGVWQHGIPSPEAFLPGTAYIQPEYVTWATDTVIGPAGDFAFGDTVDPTRPVLTTNVDRSIELSWDVFSKQALVGRTTDDPISDIDRDGDVDGSDFLTIQRRFGTFYNSSHIQHWQKNYGRAGTVTLQSVGTPHYGTARITTDTDGNPTIHYQSDPWFVGTDTITYTLGNSTTGETYEGSIDVEVLGGNEGQNPGLVATLENQALVVIGNEAPVKRVGDLLYTTAEGQNLAGNGIRDLNLFRYFSDPVDELIVRLSDGPDNGTLSLNYDGSFEYTSDPGFSGIDTFQYEVFDGLHATSAVAAINVLKTSEELVEHRQGLISNALLIFENVYGRFPSTGNFDTQGNPYLSWRVAILPFLGYQSLYDQFNLDEPWDSTNNLDPLDQMPDIFRSIGDSVNSTTTRFQTFTGPDAPFGRETDGSDQYGPRLAHFQDGPDQTLLFVESGTNQAVPWTKPDDLEFDISDPLAALGTLTSETIHGRTADGRKITLPSSINPNDFKAMVTLEGDEQVDAHTLRRMHAESQGPEAVEKFVEEIGDRYLQLIAIAMHNYANRHREGFPPGTTSAEHYDANGIPFVSWRVHILPDLGYQDLYSQFKLDEPWNSPNNLPLLDQMPDLFRSSEDSYESTTTRIMTLNGPDAPFGSRSPGSNQTGPVIRNIVDGLANTVMFIEAGADVAVPWSKPDDLSFDISDPFASLGSTTDNSFRMTMFDSSVARAPEDITPAEFSALVTENGQAVYRNRSGLPSEELLPEKPLVRSRHNNPIKGSRSIRNKMRQVGIAMSYFEDTTRRYPANSFAADGTPLLSWRVHLLRLLKYDSLYEQFHLDEPWDSPHNLALLEYMPDIFRSSGSPHDSNTTSFMTFTGDAAPFPAEGTSNREGLPSSAIRDGAFNTIAFVEAGPDVAVPWTKPTDLEFHTNNPFSSLGNIGAEFFAINFDASTHVHSSQMTPTELAARITHDGQEDLNNLPPDLSTYQFYVNQSAGDTITNEFSVDVFDVVLDKAPTSDVVLSLVISDTNVAVLDKLTLIFTPENWDVPQRVTVRGVDNFVVNPDAQVDIGVFVVGAHSDDNYDSVAPQLFSVTILDDDLVPIAGDFNLDRSVNGDDLSLWRTGYGLQVAGVTEGDANGDNRVTGSDFMAWIRNFGTVPVAGDLTYDLEVRGDDFLAWQRGFSSGYDGTDLTNWQLNYGQQTATVAAATSSPDSEPPAAAKAPIRNRGNLVDAAVLWSIAQYSQSVEEESSFDFEFYGPVEIPFSSPTLDEAATASSRFLLADLQVELSEQELEDEEFLEDFDAALVHLLT